MIKTNYVSIYNATDNGCFCRNERYYPAGAVTPPEEQLAVIQTYLREHGSGRRQDFLRLLNVSPAQGTQILRRLTARGELILTGRRYTLPKGK